MENIVYNELLIRGYNVDVGVVEVFDRNKAVSYTHLDVYKRQLLTTVKQALSVSLYEGIIFLSYFKENRIKKC